MRNILFTRRLVTIALLALAFPVLSPADEITVNGTHYKEVYVRSTAQMYYIQTPDDGKVLSALRKEVAPESVVITDDAGTREAILARWKSNNPAQARETKVREAMAEAASSEAQAASAPTNLELRGDAAAFERAAMRSNGYVPYIKLTDVPLGSALDGILRPLGLDYRIYGDYIYVSSPALLQREAQGSMVTRRYTYQGNDTMQKIVLRNPFGVAGNAQTSGFGGGFGGQQSSGAGFGGQSNFSGGQGSGGQGGGQGGGFGGGQQGGFGGGQGGGGGTDVTATSNVSELFSNIDDRLVGEAPATIGDGYYFQD
jgi:hypothetical protein